MGRRKLRLEQRKERVRDYKATMSIMKTRGVNGLKAPAASGAGRRRAPMATAVPKPPQILAEGDSWFDCPVPLFGGSIIPGLERLGVPAQNMSKAGDEVQYMLGVEGRRLLSVRLSAGCPAGGAWDVLLFSGDGNDIVANPMALWIRDYDPQLMPEQQIHAARFNTALAMVQRGYEDLIEICNRLSPDTRLFFLCYDFAMPHGRGIWHLGPWLKPTFDLRGFPSTEVAAEVAQAMLKQFAAVLQKVHHPAKGVFHQHAGHATGAKIVLTQRASPFQIGFQPVCPDASCRAEGALSGLRARVEGEHRS